jgi:hypothetical protein
VPSYQAEQVLMLAAAVTRIRSRGDSVHERVRRQRTDPPLVPGRAGLQVCLGLVWLLDAGLQYQPFMFGPFFVTQIIQPTTAGTPAIVSTSVFWATEVMLRHIALYNGLFATIQLLIAIGILVPRTRRPALAISIGWAISVWWFGESLGGIFTGASPLGGLPGGVILYALIAVLLWPMARVRDRQPASPATSGLLGPGFAHLAWLILWGSFSYFLLLPANRAPAAISQIFSVTDGQPGWITALMNALSNLAGQRGLQISLVLALLCAFAAAGVFIPRLRRPAVAIAGAVALVFWVAEGLGGIFTGEGTDPNSGLLLLLLAACFWPRSRPEATTTTNSGCPYAEEAPALSSAAA